MEPSLHPDNVSNPTGKTINKLWTALVYGLVAVLVLGLIGTFVLISDGNADTDPAPIVTIMTAALTGLLGLFVTPAKETDQDV